MFMVSTTVEALRKQSKAAFIKLVRSTLQLLCLVMMIASALRLAAQVATGDILGKVTDTTGANVVDASVRLANNGTQEVRTFVTKENGEYIFTALQPGTYTVTVSSASFKTFNTSDIVVLASDRVRINASLQPGSAAEAIEVTATPTSLQTDVSTVGSTITEKTLTDAPLNGRNYIGIVQVQPGVNPGFYGSLAGGSQQSDRRLTSSVSANGQPEVINNNLVDGMDNNSRASGLVELRPSIEAIAEVRTDINLYNAEVGRTGGAVINVITKSGTNNFHGSVYEFFRNDITDSRNFFAYTSVLARKPELRQNQFGGSFAGPIFRDRTFFFADYEGFRQINGNNTVYLSTVPTTAAPAKADPTALSYFKLFPSPNLPGTSNNYLSDPAATLNSSLGDLRVDNHFTPNDTLFGRYSYNRTQAYVPNPFPNVNGVAAGGLLSGTGDDTVIIHNGLFDYTHIFNPRLLLELKAGYTYFDIFATAPNYGSNLNDTSTYMIPNANECGGCSGLAPINIVGFSPVGDPIALPTTDIEHTTQFAGSLTYALGRQTFKAGEALIRRNVSFSTPVYNKGLFIFSSLPAFFNGAPYVSTRQALLVKPYERSWEPSAYFQDDWRVTDHLTLNLGVRYDVFVKPNQKYNNFANFDLASLTLIENATGGIGSEFHNVSPRVGFAATIAPGTVLRGGFGLTFFPGDTNNSFFLNNPPIGFSTGNVVDLTPISTTGVASVVAQSTNAATIFGGVISKPLHDTDSYLEQFNLLLQKDVRGTVFTAGYVGELGRHLFDEVPNAGLPAPAGPGHAAAPPPLIYAAQLPRVTTISYFADFGTSSYNSLQLSVERRISHGLTANFNYTYSHTLDDVLETFSGDGSAFAGFGLLPSQISTYDHGNSPLDLKDRFAGFFNYDLPFGSSGSRVYKAAVGGLRLNGLGFWQTGSPFTVVSAATLPDSLATINLPTVTTDKPNVVAKIVTTGAVAPGSTYFNLNAFAQQTYGTAGNESRGALFGPRLRRGDLSLFKTIHTRASQELELRAECINITNTPNFAKPNFTIAAYAGSVAAGGAVPTTAGGFGTITNTAFGYSGRQFQFAARYSF